MVATGGATVINVGGIGALATVIDCGYNRGKIYRLTAIPIKITPITPEIVRISFPTEGIFIADTSNPPPRIPIRKKIAPMKSRAPSLVCGIMTS
jgi:hypothetical protein